MCNNHTRKRREQRKRQKNKMNTTTSWFDPWTIKLVSIPDQSSAKTVPEKKENPMYIDYVSSDKHSESARTNYLLSRFNDVRRQLKSDLRKQFGLENDETPYLAKDLISRILDGKYILPTEKEEELMRSQSCWPYNPLHGIKWRDPAIKEDQAGFDTAVKQLEKDGQDVHDAIMIKTNDEALAAIKAFEAWKSNPTTTSTTA